MSKVEKVEALVLAAVAADATISRKDLIAKVMTECGMTDGGASTYVYNATKKHNIQLGGKSPKTAPAEAKKPDPIVEAAKAKTEEVVAEKPAEQVADKPKTTKSRKKAPAEAKEAVVAKGASAAEVKGQVEKLLHNLDLKNFTFTEDDVPAFLKK